MRIFSLTLAFCLVLGAAAPAHAAKGGDEKTPVATQLARLMLPKSVWNDMVSSVQKSQQPVLSQIAGGDAKKLEKATKRFDSEVSRLMSYDEMTTLQSKALASNYTQPEMKELVKFYRTDVGQKSLKVAPKVMQESWGVMQQRLGSELPKVMQQLQAEMGPPQGQPGQPGQPGQQGQPGLPMGQ